jgi:cobaltochelatase CobS
MSSKTQAVAIKPDETGYTIKIPTVSSLVGLANSKRIELNSDGKCNTKPKEVEGKYVWVLDTKSFTHRIGTVRSFSSTSNGDLTQVEVLFKDRNGLIASVFFNDGNKFEYDEYQVMTDDVISEFKPIAIRGGSSPSKVYVHAYPKEEQLQLELAEVETGGASITLDHQFYTATYNSETLTSNTDKSSIYPKALVDAYLEHSSAGFVDNSSAVIKVTLDKEVKSAVDALLEGSSATTIDELLREVNAFRQFRIDQVGREKLTKEQLAEMQKELSEARSKIATANFKPPEMTYTHTNTNQDHQIPKGELKWVPASDVFKPPAKYKSVFSFEVPVWTWFEEKLNGDGVPERVEAVHPHVPIATADYIFRPEQLLQILWALVTNKKAWLSGHTGTGKSTLVAEICARLGYPMIRVNFDSEITRMDLIRREVLRQENGTTVSEFADGILPQAIAQPCVLLCDEMDFIRPDVAYVMQRALEDEGLMITDDGGRMVSPHPMFRIFATANTVGQGDDYGNYQGARNQSMAFLDRFTVWISVDYLRPNEEKALIKSRVPDLSDSQAELVIKYVKEHRSAFIDSEIAQPLSPRGVIALAEAIVMFGGLYPDEETGTKIAVNATILNKANPQDRNVLEGVIDRVF